MEGERRRKTTNFRSDHIKAKYELYFVRTFIYEKMMKYCREGEDVKCRAMKKVFSDMEEIKVKILMTAILLWYLDILGLIPQPIKEILSTEDIHKLKEQLFKHT